MRQGCVCLQPYVHIASIADQRCRMYKRLTACECLGPQCVVSSLFTKPGEGCVMQPAAVRPLLHASLKAHLRGNVQPLKGTQLGV